MIHIPNKKEMIQLQNLNKGYKMIADGLKIIDENSPKNDGDIDVYRHRACKNIKLLISKATKLLESTYISKEFNNIVKYINKDI